MKAVTVRNTLMTGVEFAKYVNGAEFQQLASILRSILQTYTLRNILHMVSEIGK